MMHTVKVRHNIEVAHRLWQLPGKCQNIHGHSMWVELEMQAMSLKGGIALDAAGHPLEFGAIKKMFRGYLDEHFDHRLLLHADDPFATQLHTYVEDDNGTQDTFVRRESMGRLPGLKATAEDPSTENIAKWIASWAHGEFRLPLKVTVQETHVNAATAEIII